MGLRRMIDEKGTKSTRVQMISDGANQTFVEPTTELCVSIEKWFWPVVLDIVCVLLEIGWVDLYELPDAIEKLFRFD